MGNQITEIQDQFCSSYDKRKLCSFDIEYIDTPTKPLIHQAARYLFFTKGHGSMTVDSKSYEIRPHTFVAILPWESTEVTAVDAPLEFFKIIYNSDFINNTIKFGYNTGNNFFNILSSVQSTPIVQCTEEEAAVILRVLNEIKNETGIESILDVPEERELSNVYVTNKLMELLIHFTRFARKRDCRNEKGDSIELDERGAIFKYIYSHLNQKQTLSELSSLFYMSESSISKYVMDVTGLTFSDLVNEMRIVKMMDLLMYTDMTLNELAEMTGFVDASHVLKVFSARTGVTPKEYRKIDAGTNNLFKEREKSVSFEVFNYIYHNFQEDLKIQAVADKFGVTVVELNRILLFQAERNFEDFLNYLRVNKACELMLSTKMSITDIAIEVGYNTVKTFSRNFVKLKNMTPATFRKRIILQHGGESIPEAQPAV